MRERFLALKNVVFLGVGMKAKVHILNKVSMVVGSNPGDGGTAT